MRRRLVQAGLILWAMATVALGSGWYWEHRDNEPLREQLALYKRLDGTLQNYCEGVQKVNAVCEGQLIDIMQRLGLDNEMMPLVTTALWKRATNGLRVSEARRMMGARKYATGFLERSRLDLEAIGGPSEDEDEALAGGPQPLLQEKPK